jgi:DNA-binding beta-propeller fold protein YncE
MNCPKNYLTGICSRCISASLLLIFLRFFCLALQAGPVPQFAFSIDSAQIPGGMWPVSLGIGPTGSVYVASVSSVVKLAPNGAYSMRWGTQGTGPGQFSGPGPFAFDQAGDIYVADSYNDRIEKFDSGANFLTAWGSYGTGPGQFDYPEGLAVDSSGRVYVADSFNSRIEVFASSGAFLRSFGSIGTNDGQFWFSGVTAIDSSNNVYVVDFPGGSYDNFRVQKFDASGAFLTQWASRGPNPNPAGGLQVPGIATDSANNVYVVDGANNNVQKFTSDGVFLGLWGSYGTGPGEFNNPMGIAIDPSGNYIYVADYYNARINVFAYAPLAPVIYQSPTNQTLPAGSTLTLAVGAFGAQPLTYQWQFQGTNLPAATNAALVITNVSLAASGSYAVLASNALGTARSTDASITVLPVIVTTLPATGISATGAVLNGSVALGSNPSSAWFEWGSNSGYGNIAGLTNLNANTNVALSLAFTNLSGTPIYHYRLAGSNSLGVVYGQDAQFQVGLKPAVITLPVRPVAPDSVVLNASVNPEARDTSSFFRWGISNPYAHTTPTNQIGSGITPVPVQNLITGLTSGFIYTVQAVAANELGTVSGAIVNFIAPPWSLLPVPPQQVWSAIATSADGSRLASVAPDGRICVSVDSGMNWTSNAIPNQAWQGITMSADGRRLIAVADAGLSGLAGSAYFSTNFGNTWAKAAGPDHNWHAVASSADGLKVAGVDAAGQHVLTSTNGGLKWATNSPTISASWSTIASSADGLKLIVGAGGVDFTTNGPLYTSTDAGLSWASNNLANQYWRSVASSADGQTLAAAVGGRQSGPIYVSTNAGVSWTLTSAPVTNWQCVTISADGAKLAAIVRVEARPVFTSTNWGLSWQPQTLPQAIWSAIVSSADGARLYAAGDQNIFTLQMSPTPLVKPRIAGSQLYLSWIIPSAPFVLQQATDLSASDWTNRTASPATVFSNLHYQVQIPALGQRGFYRLKGQ